MREAGYGRILFVSSGSGIYGNFGQSNYAAAKMGILGLANTLAREGARRGIVVNTIAPIAASRMTESVLPPDLLAALSPDAVAPFAAFLVHEACTTTGAVFELGAGWISRLRWQRARGAALPLPPPGPTADGVEPISLEAVRDAWGAVGDFSAASTYPDSTQASFEPMLASLQQSGGGRAAAAASVDGGGGDGTELVGAVSAAELRTAEPPTPAAAAVFADLPRLGLPPLPGGNVGKSAAVDVSRVLASGLRSTEHSYGHREAALYALSVGACADGPVAAASSPGDELGLVYELSESPRALPSMAVLWQHTAMSELTSLPGLSFNPMLLLHGEQELILPNGPLPAAAAVTTHARVANVFDKGRGALVVCEAVSIDRATGAVLAVNRASIFIRGVGGFGGDRGPAPPAWPVPPGTAPTASLRYSTSRSQALLYRLNGDLNPLHVDPGMAAVGGFPQPILHGLCSFGIAGRALEAEAAREGGALHAALARLDRGGGGRGGVRLAGLRGRFTKHVFPGDTLVIDAWVPRAAADSAAAVSFRVWVIREGAEGSAAVFADDAVVLANGEAKFVVSGSSAAVAPRL